MEPASTKLVFNNYGSSDEQNSKFIDLSQSCHNTNYYSAIENNRMHTNTQHQYDICDSQGGEGYKTEEFYLSDTIKLKNINYSVPMNCSLENPIGSLNADYDECIISCDITSPVLKCENILSPYSAFSSLTIDLYSPKPIFTFSPKEKSIAIKNFKLYCTVKELIDTEESHISSLKMLQYYYLEPMVYSSPYQCSLLLRMRVLVESFIKVHSNLLISMHTYFHEFINISNESKFNELLRDLFSSIEREIDISRFVDYFNTLEDLMDYVRIKSLNLNLARSLSLNEELLRGWEIFIEATQPEERQLDLSFNSLSQRPISRLTKYLLILKSLRDTASYNFGIESYLMNEVFKVLLDKLFYLNTAIKSEEFNAATPMDINKIVDFSSISSEYKLSSEFFGKPILVGCVCVLWMEKKVEKSTLAAFLYKSHLLLVSYSKRWYSKGTIKFIIPFSMCKIIVDLGSEIHGFSSTYNDSCKLLFFDYSKEYEICLFFLNQVEGEIWKQHLLTLINELNGPYRSEEYFPSDGCKILCFTPKCCLYRYMNDPDYEPYGDKISQVHFSSFYSSRNYAINLKSKNREPETLAFSKYIVNVSFPDRYKIELVLHNLWSNKLPLFCIDNSDSMSTFNAIKRWGSLRIYKKSELYDSNRYFNRTGNDAISNSNPDDTAYEMPSGAKLNEGVSTMQITNSDSTFELQNDKSNVYFSGIRSTRADNPKNYNLRSLGTIFTRCRTSK